MEKKKERKNRMKNKKKGIITYSLFFVACLLLLSGCQKQEVDTKTVISVIDENVSKGGSLVTVFRVENNRVTASEETYQLKQPDSLSASFEEIMTQLSMPEGLHYSGYQIDENGNVEIEFESNDEAEASREQMLLGKAAMVSTLVQIKQMGHIRILITKADGTQDISDYDADSFFFYDETGLSNRTVGTVSLYLPEGTEAKVYPTEMSVSLDGTETLSEKVLSLLAARGAFPEGTVVKGVTEAGTTAFVDLGAEILTLETDMDANAVIYSVVNTLTTLPHISNVQFLFDGVREDLYRGVMVSGPMTFEDEMVVQQ